MTTGRRSQEEPGRRAAAPVIGGVCVRPLAGFEAGQAPRRVLRATHEGASAHCSLADLKPLAVDLA